MPPYFSILFLTILLSFLRFTAAKSLAARETEKPPRTTFDSDIRDVCAWIYGDASSCSEDEWAEFVSLFDLPSTAEETQEASLASTLLGILSTENGDRVQSKVQSSVSSESRPELQRSLESFFSEETEKITECFETVIKNTAALGMALQDILGFAYSDSIPSSNASLAPLLKQIVKLVAIASDDFVANFPLPATAPGHANRVKHMSEALGHLQWLVIRFARNYNVEPKAAERYLALANPVFRDVGVFIGDIVELYPAAIEALVLNLSAILLPEAVFLRSLLILYCFGPYVLGKDAVSGWLLQHVSDTFKVWKP